MAGLAGGALTGEGSDEEAAGGLFVVGVFVPEAVIVELPAVVAEEDDHGGIAEAFAVEGGEEAADEGIGVGDAGVVGADEFAGFFGGDFAVTDVAVVAEFAGVGAGKGGSAGGGLGVVGHFDFVEGVEVEVLGRGDEGEVGFGEADAEEEGVLFEGGECGDGLIESAAVGELVVGLRGCFPGGAAGAGGAGGGRDSPVVFLEALFEALGAGAGFGGVPGGLLIGAPPGDGPTGVVVETTVEEFAEAGGGEAVLLEELGEGDGVGHGAAEVVLEVVDFGGVGAEAGEEAGAGGAADGLLAIGVGEDGATAGEGVDVGGMNVAGAVATELGTHVVDGNEQDVADTGGGEQGGGQEGGKQIAAAHGRDDTLRANP